MTTPHPAAGREDTRDDELRRRLVLFAGIAGVLAVLHFLDHAVRGQLVINGGLNPEWNHSGWPFNTETDKPYLFPIYFVVVCGLLFGGVLLTLRRRLWARYWLFTSVLLIALLLFVHFVGASSTAAETPSVIAESYSGIGGAILALSDLFGLFAVLLVLAFQAVGTRRLSGRW